MRMLNSTLNGYKYGEKLVTMVLIPDDPTQFSSYRLLIFMNLFISGSVKKYVYLIILRG